MPDLTMLPRGHSVFVDTNIFYFHFTGKSATSTAFFGRVARGEIIAYVNTEVLSDLLHKLMLAEAGTKIGKGLAWQLKKHLSTNRTAIAALPDHQAQFERTLAMGLKVIPITKTLLIDTKQERSTYGLMTNDSLHLGTMNRRSVPLTDIATHDSDFGHIPTITMWEPQDIARGT